VAAPFAAAAGILAVGLRAFGAAGAAGAGQPLRGSTGQSTGQSHGAQGARGGREKGGGASSGCGSPVLYVACAHVFVCSAVFSARRCVQALELAAKEAAAKEAAAKEAAEKEAARVQVAAPLCCTWPARMCLCAARSLIAALCAGS
jgi:hypothetical protein